LLEHEGLSLAMSQRGTILAKRRKKGRGEKDGPRKTIRRFNGQMGSRKGRRELLDDVFSQQLGEKRKSTRSRKRSTPETEAIATKTNLGVERPA